MSHLITPGRESTEHRRAWRSEALGAVLVAAGLLLVFLGGSLERMAAGVLLIAIGACLFAHTASAYARSRGEVKAASVRRPAQSAPRI